MKRQVFFIFCLLLLLIFVTPVSAFTMDTVEVRIDDHGNGIIDFHYSLNWYEKLSTRALALLYGGERELIQKKFSSALGKDVYVKDLNLKTSEASLLIPGIVDYRIENDAGYWISYTGVKPTGSISIEDVKIIYPDGFFLSSTGKIPSGIHFVDNNLAVYYTRALFYQDYYSSTSVLYYPTGNPWEELKKSGGKFVGDTGLFKAMLDTELGSYGSNFYKLFPKEVERIIEAYEQLSELRTGGPFKVIIEDPECISKFISGTTFNSLMTNPSNKQFAPANKDMYDDMNQLSELKKDEVNLLEKFVSEPLGDDYRFNDETYQSLITNLNQQKEILKRLNEKSQSMVDITKKNKDFIEALDKNLYSKILNLYELSVQASAIDLQNVEEELKYLQALEPKSVITKEFTSEDFKSEAPRDGNIASQLSYDDGLMDTTGSRSPSGHAVFFSGENGLKVSGIQLYSYRYDEIDQGMTVELWDEDLKTIYSKSYDYEDHFPYSYPQDSEAKLDWVTITIPDVQVDGGFYVVLFTNSFQPSWAASSAEEMIDEESSAEETYVEESNDEETSRRGPPEGFRPKDGIPEGGIMIGLDTSSNSGNSYVANQNPNSLSKYKANWMIRVIYE
mgnify:CR=1 FL=1